MKLFLLLSLSFTCIVTVACGTKMSQRGGASVVVDSRDLGILDCFTESISCSGCSGCTWGGCSGCSGCWCNTKKPTSYPTNMPTGYPTSSPTSKPTEQGFLLGNIPDDTSEERLLRGTWKDSVKAVFSTFTSWDWNALSSEWDKLKSKNSVVGYLSMAYLANVGSGFIFPYFNFVSGFENPSWFDKVGKFFVCTVGRQTHKCNKWNEAKQGEKMGVISYFDFAKENFNVEFDPLFKEYYTGAKIPSWEDNENHKAGISLLDAGISLQQKAQPGVSPTQVLYEMNPRFAFDTKFDPNGIASATWEGFDYFGPREISHASNGIFGVDHVNKLLDHHKTNDVLGVLMTDSVFAAHLVFDIKANEYTLDLQRLGNYAAIPGYSRLGGEARFAYKNGRLVTTLLSFGGKTYTNFDDKQTETNYANSKLSGWRYAEKQIIASLLSMTNLIMHVKDLHLELAAAFQATTVDSFASNVQHSVRRLLDPFIHRSAQATNDNFKLLFKYKAAEFSLAPLPYDEQLRLIADEMKTNPIYLDELDMFNYGKVRGWPEAISQKSAQNDNGVWFNRWHYRALTVQKLFEQHIRCHLEKNNIKDVAVDPMIRDWWTALKTHIPAFNRAISRQSPAVLGERSFSGMNVPTNEGFVRLVAILMTWLSFIHEDVGHSAAAFVFNPVHTPMCVPDDGVGIPMYSYLFNTVAYRGFVFLERAKLLDDSPLHWFSNTQKCDATLWSYALGGNCPDWYPGCTCEAAADGDMQCFENLKTAIRNLGKIDIAFSECDTNGFYSCVERVETAVSS